MRRFSSPYDDDITAEQAARVYTNAQLAQFHAYNPRGILAEWREMSDLLIELGRGYAAYGDHGFYYKHLTRLAGARRVCPHDLQATLSGISRTIARGKTFLGAGA